MEEGVAPCCAGLVVRFAFGGATGPHRSGRSEYHGMREGAGCCNVPLQQCAARTTRRHDNAPHTGEYHGLREGAAAQLSELQH